MKELISYINQASPENLDSEALALLVLNTKYHKTLDRLVVNTVDQYIANYLIVNSEIPAVASYYSNRYKITPTAQTVGCFANKNEINREKLANICKLLIENGIPLPEWCTPDYCKTIQFCDIADKRETNKIILKYLICRYLGLVLGSSDIIELNLKRYIGTNSFVIINKQYLNDINKLIQSQADQAESDKKLSFHLDPVTGDSDNILNINGKYKNREFIKKLKINHQFLTSVRSMPISVNLDVCEFFVEVQNEYSLVTTYKDQIEKIANESDDENASSDYANKINFAEEFLSSNAYSKFYFPHAYDTRGRHYAKSYPIGLQGTTLDRTILTTIYHDSVPETATDKVFRSEESKQNYLGTIKATEELINANYAYIHLADILGKDKCSKEQKYEYVQAIIDYYTNDCNSDYDKFVDSDLYKKLQQIAKSEKARKTFEYTVYNIINRLNGIKVPLFIGIDANSSGTQLLSTCFADTELAKTVGLSDRNSGVVDAYTATTKAVLGDNIVDEHSRKELKNVIMTYFYGSTHVPYSILKKVKFNKFKDGMKYRFKDAYSYLTICKVLSRYPERIKFTLPDGHEACNTPYSFLSVTDDQELQEIAKSLSDGKNNPFKMTIKLHNDPTVYGKSDVTFDIEDLNTDTRFECVDNSSSVSLAANYVHATDGYIARELSSRANYDEQKVTAGLAVINQIKAKYASEYQNVQVPKVFNIKAISIYDLYKLAKFGNEVVDKAETFDSILAEFPELHRGEELVELAEQLLTRYPFYVSCVHDCFYALEDYMPIVEQLYSSILQENANSATILNLICQHPMVKTWINNPKMGSFLFKGQDNPEVLYNNLYYKSQIASTSEYKQTLSRLAVKGSVNVTTDENDKNVYQIPDRTVTSDLYINYNLLT